MSISDTQIHIHKDNTIFTQSFKHLNINHLAGIHSTTLQHQLEEEEKNTDFLL